MNKLLSVLIPLAIVCGPVRSEAQSRIMVVKVSDLNLRTASGAARALQRAQAAAREYCGRSGWRRDHADFVQLHCRERMMREAVEAMGSPVVMQFHRSIVTADLGATG